jgi:thymidylate kinase
LFLSFYNFDYWKASLYKLATRIAFSLRLTRLLSNGSIDIYSADQPLFMTSLVNANNATLKSNYAVFTGTAGPNRKIVIADAGRGYLSHFFKIALNSQSAGNISNEFRMLKKLESNPQLEGFIPKTEDINRNTICVSNICPDNYNKSKSWSAAHTQFLTQLYSTGRQQCSFNELPALAGVLASLSEAAAAPAINKLPIAKALHQQLKKLLQQLQQQNPLVSFACGHGDFTRWNCYYKKNNLFVYDWELGRTDLPLLFDFFHFNIQGNIFAENMPAQDIQLRLEKLMQEPAIRDLLPPDANNPQTYYQLYLLINASYYLNVYLKQEILHKEAYWLFDTWQSLIQDSLATQPGQSGRQQCIEDFLAFMQDREYVLLKSAGKSVRSLSEESDIDLLLSAQAQQKAVDWLMTYPGVQKCKRTNRSFMVTLEIFFNDHSFLSIDLLTGFNRKSYEYINPALMLASRQAVDGVQVLPPAWDYLYIYLFYQLNFSSIPEKYQAPFLQLAELQQATVLQNLQEQTGIQHGSLEQSFPFSAANRKKIFHFLQQRPSNRFAARCIRWCQHKRDTLRDMRQRKGFMLTFSGVDGAGKSTILNEVKEMLQRKYRKKVVVIRHRPSMLPILSAMKYGKEAAEQRCAERLPRQGTNKNILSSLARFGYYYADYLFGQLVVYFRYTLRGYIVLYDRYYFDFIVDGRRSNITISKSFIRNLYVFVYKPQLNIFLYAPPEVILKRKKELSAGDITQLTNEYTTLFNRLGEPAKYMCIENIDKGRTMERIEQAIIQLN